MNQQVQCRIYNNDDTIDLCTGQFNQATSELVHDQDINVTSIKEEHIVFPNGNILRVTMIGPDYENDNKTFKFVAYKSEREAKEAKDRWNRQLHNSLAELSNKITGMTRCIEIIEENTIESFSFWELLFTLLRHPIRFPFYINTLANRRTLKKIEHEINQYEDMWSVFLEAYETTKYDK